MSILDVLAKAGGAAAALVNLLAKIQTAAPDLAAEADKVLAGLTEAIAPDNLVRLAEALPQELVNISQGKLDPRRHPSDVA
jgi:hypothetical protein